jgi:hypothetical protein
VKRWKDVSEGGVGDMLKVVEEGIEEVVMDVA